MVMHYFGEYVNIITNNSKKTKWNGTVHTLEYAHGFVVFVVLLF